jgi:drug/metabolite transporter (DMT)-like permease
VAGHQHRTPLASQQPQQLRRDPQPLPHPQRVPAGLPPDRRLQARLRGHPVNTPGAQTLVLFITSAITGVVLVAPQPSAALGTELILVAITSGTAVLVLDRRAGHDPDNRVAQYIERASPNTLTAILIAVAGVTFLVKAGGGLYWLIPAVVASLVGGVVNAWLFLIKVPASN